MIIEEESEVDPNEEFESLADNLKKSITKSFFDSPRAGPLTSALSEYNRKATEEGVTADCTDATQVSFCLEKRVETEASSQEQSENVEYSEDEANGVQHPAPSFIQPIQKAKIETKEEDIVPTPQGKLVKRINFSVVQKADNRIEKAVAKNVVSDALLKREELKDARKVVDLLKDFKEGWLGKKSNSMLTLWKQKYCRVGNSQFIWFKDVAAGWVSGFIDFRRVPSKVTFDKSTFCFT